jgi:hypothetical protein
VEPVEQPPGLGEKIGKGIEWIVDYPVLKPLADAIRKRPELAQILGNMPMGPGAIGQLSGLIGGLTVDEITPETLQAAIQAGGAEALPAAAEVVAPIDIATVGTGIGAGMAAKAGLKGATALGAVSRALDVAEGVYGGGQVVSGVQEGNLAEIGVGVARLAGGTAAAIAPTPGTARAKAAPDTAAAPEMPTPEVRVHEAGKPLTRRRLQNQLLELGVTGDKMRGKSATEMRAMLRERGATPERAGAEPAGMDPTLFDERVEAEGRVDVPPDEPVVEMPQPEVAPSGGQLRLRQATADQGILRLAVDKATPSTPDMIETMLARSFPGHHVDVAQLRSPGFEAGNDLYRVTLARKDTGATDYGAAQEAEKLLGGRLARERGQGPAKGPGRTRARQLGLEEEPAPTLFDERTAAESGIDVPPREGFEEAPKIGEIPEPGLSRIAWHPEHGVVRVDDSKGSRVMVTTGRRRPRLVDKSDLVPVKENTPQSVAADRMFPEEEGRAKLSEAEAEEFGIEPGPARTAPTVSDDIIAWAQTDARDAGFEGSLVDRLEGMERVAAENPSDSKWSVAEIRRAIRQAESTTKQHPSLRRRKRAHPFKGAVPPAPTGKLKDTGLTPGVQTALRRALVEQRTGRVAANQKNLALHVRQIGIMRKWDDAIKAREISATEGRLKEMQELDGLKAGIEGTPDRPFSPEQLEELQLYSRDQPWTHDVPEKFRMANTIENIQQGRQLQQNELKSLRRLLGPAFAPETALEKTLLEQLLQVAMLTSGTLRSLRAMDVASAAMRQALPATISHPVLAARSFWGQMRSLVSERQFRAIENGVFTNPMIDLNRASGLHLADLQTARTTREAVQMGGRGTAEELYENTLLGSVPIIGRLARGAERAYITYLNLMRVGLFNKMAYSYMHSGVTPETNPHVFTDLADAVNKLTGRGGLEVARISPESAQGRMAGLSKTLAPGGETMEKAAPLLTSLLFAPRFNASRLALLRDLPFLYSNYSKPVRQLLMKDMFITIGAITSTLSAGAALGLWQVEWDPRSSDFAKPRVGRVRFDVWGGLQQFVRFAAQFTTGERKSPRTGKIYTMGEGIAPGRLAETARFIRQKASPPVSIFWDQAEGETVVGEPADFLQDQFPYMSKYTARQVSPFVLEDMEEVAQEADRELLAVTVPLSHLGIGIQAFEEPGETGGGPY